MWYLTAPDFLRTGGTVMQDSKLGHQEWAIARDGETVGWITATDMTPSWSGDRHRNGPRSASP